MKVTNKHNGRSVVVTINDRGPFVRGRVIDVTPAAARVLGFSGLAQVSVDASEVERSLARDPASKCNAGQRSIAFTSMGAQLRRPDRTQS